MHFVVQDKNMICKEKCLTSKCSSIYGGFVIPILIIAPSGMISTNFNNNSGRETPKGMNNNYLYIPIPK